MWGITVALCCIVSILVFLLYRKRYSQLTVFQQLGIPGPEPHWFYGNLHTLNKSQLHQTLQKWTATYGKVFGYYEGPRPILVISDLDMVKQIFLKKFSTFNGRKEFPISPPPDSDFNHMFLASGKRWKRLRTIINPTFSTGKLKQMFPLVEGKIDILLKKLLAVAEKEQPVEMMSIYQGLTLDVIADIAFGLDVDSQNNPDEPFLKHCRQVFANLDQSKRPLLVNLAMFLPEIREHLWGMFSWLMYLFKTPEIKILGEMQSVIDTRQEQKYNRVDLLQLMLDAEAEKVTNQEDSFYTMTTEDEVQSQLPDVSSDVKSSGRKPSAIVKKGGPKFEKKLTIKEIKSQSFLFLIAGYETTSTALTYCSYLLAVNPQIQETLLAEVDNFLPDGTEATYEIIQKMPYLHMVVCETLRLYPLASNVVNRICDESCTVGGYHIPEKMNVQLDAWSIHYNADIWGSNPEQFNPERFSKKEMEDRHPMAWLPFGAGPRNCVGLRFALIEAKLTLARVLQKMSFQQCAETEIPLTLLETGVIVPKNGLKIKLRLRNQ